MKLLVADRSSVAGGVERLCTSLFPRLAARGVRVTWLCPEHRIPFLSRQVGNASVEFVPVDWPRANPRRWISALARRGGESLRWVSDAVYLARVERVAQEVHADTVLFPWIIDDPVPSPGALPRLTAMLHDRNWGRFPQNFERSPDALDRHVGRWLAVSEKIFTISESVAAEIRQTWSSPAATIHSIPLAAHLHLSPGRLEAMGPDSAGPKRFYYPGTLSAHKGHETLLEAAGILAGEGAQFELHLTGHGTDTLHVPGLSSIVHGHGYVDRETVEALYLGADAVVLPSRYEGFGLPLAEAIGWGVPVICSDIPPFREQITRMNVPDCVRLFPAGDARAMAAGMRSILAMPKLSPVERYGIAEHVRNWTWEVVADEYIRVMMNT